MPDEVKIWLVVAGGFLLGQLATGGLFPCAPSRPGELLAWLLVVPALQTGALLVTRRAAGLRSRLKGAAGDRLSR